MKSVQSLLRAALELRKQIFSFKDACDLRAAQFDEEGNELPDAKPILLSDEDWKRLIDQTAMVLVPIVAMAQDKTLAAHDRQAAIQGLMGYVGPTPELNGMLRELQEERKKVGRTREQGYVAAEQGKDWKDNPHTRGTIDYEYWERGWCQAKNMDRATWRPQREVFAEARQAQAGDAPA